MLLLLKPVISIGQYYPEPKGDTLHSIPPLQKRVVATDTDKLVLKLCSKEIMTNNSDRFYSALEKQANRNFLMRGLHNIILSEPKNDGNSDTLNTSLSILPFISYRDHIIRHIRFKRISVFGPTIDDPDRLAKSWIERAGNKLHFQSKLYLIRNNLLFEENQTLDPVELADNERLLRSLPYIEDARIIVQPVSKLNDSVDILVLTKDVWANAFDIKINDMYSGTFELWDRNIFGFGHEIQNKFPWDSRKNSSTGYNGIYTINNIAGSFIQGKLNYFSAFDTKIYGLTLQRSFFTPNIKYAGGLAIGNTSTQAEYKDTSFTKVPINYSSYDGWIGRSFLIQKDEFTKIRRNITLTGRLTNTYFSQRPAISENSYYNYQNKTLFLGAISYTKLSYFKSNFIYNYGRTEDIPIGAEITSTFGVEKNEFFNRRYGGLQISSSNFMWNFGYIFASVNFSSFFDQFNVDEQGIINANLNYFSPLILANRLRLRQFVNIDFTHGSNRFINEYLTINNKQGLRGFTNDSITGNTRLNMHWETVCFTPWFLYDFRFVAFTFADFSWIAKQPEYLFDKFPYTGIGFGIRIRNERLVFNTFQIRFAFYPNLPAGSSTKALDLSGESLIHFRSFNPTAPQLVQYQ